MPYYYYNPLENIMEKRDSETVSIGNRVTGLENVKIKLEYYAEISTVSGQIIPPTGSTILLDQYQNGIDAVLSGIPGGSGTKPDLNDTGLDVTSFDTSGNYIISGPLTTTPSALIYIISIDLKDWSNLDLEFILTQSYLGIDPTNYFNKTLDDLDDILDGTAYVKSENNYTDTEKTNLSNQSGTNTGDETLSTLSIKLDTATVDTILDADEVNFHDNVDSVLKKISWLNIKATLKTYFDTLYTRVHSSLSNLTWSTAGHTIDTTLDMNSNNITEIANTQYDITYTPTGSEPTGTSYWDSTNQTISTVLDNGIVGQHFQEDFIIGQNNTGSILANGTVATYTSSIGNSGNIRIAHTVASSSEPTFMTLGIITEPIANGVRGKITTRGKVRGIQTNGANYGETWNDADILYKSSTIAGGLTKVAPDAPIPAIPIAVVISAHATNGTLLVRPTYPNSLTMLTDVNGTALTVNKQIPVWDNINNYFDFTEVYGEFGDKSGGNYATFNNNGELRLYGDATQWDDLRFPFIGRNLDTSSGRIDYNYTELGIDFADNSRLAETEQISMIVQFPHSWKTGSVISPHLHWIQSSADMPNWLISYRWYDNGDTIPLTWTNVKYGVNAFTYTSGSILQLTEFEILIPVGITGISSILDIKFYRDADNTSGLFVGSDPLTGNALAKEFDIHYQLDSLGSNEEYIKY